MQVAELIAALAAPLLAIIGMIYGFGRWSGKIDANTKSTDKLAASFDAHTERIDNRVNEHEVRIRLLEQGYSRSSPIPVVTSPVLLTSATQSP